ncbi:MAG: outer membrane protein assembly factor BamD [Proteobacteria bacterium]|nr:outer membrane protein assembly factor BamD [Pseudomonadota bacterium]
MNRFAPLTLIPVLAACTVQSSVSSHYLAGERLWTAKNYRAAVSEFDEVAKESPNSPVGLQALWRASTTREWFLNEPEEALKGFDLFLERAGTSELAPQALIEVGEIYFSRLNKYPKAIEHYEKLLASSKFGPEDRAKFAYRVGRSHFLMNHLKRAIDIYEAALASYPGTAMIPRIKYDLANAWYALGETDKTAYSKALRIFEGLAEESRNSDHRLYVESVFGAAAALEEQDELDKALERFKLIETDYPAPNVIKIRMYRISERKKKRQK